MGGRRTTAAGKDLTMSKTMQDYFPPKRAKRDFKYYVHRGQATKAEAEAAAAMAATAVLHRVEDTPGVLATVFALLLTEPADLARAGATCRAWRAVAEADAATWWQEACRHFPLVSVLKARPSCTLSWRQLYVQRVLTNRCTMPDEVPAPPRTDYQIGVEMHLCPIPQAKEVKGQLLAEWVAKGVAIGAPLDEMLNGSSVAESFAEFAALDATTLAIGKVDMEAALSAPAYPHSTGMPNLTVHGQSEHYNRHPSPIPSSVV